MVIKIANMMTAGIAAMADLTMNTTIDMNGILISTIVTSVWFGLCGLQQFIHLSVNDDQEC